MSPDAPPADGGLTRRILQRVVLPADRDLDVLPLYVDRDKAELDLSIMHVRNRRERAMIRTMSRAGNAGDDNLDPQAILDRRRVRVRAGERLSFGTYFNGFAASYWRRWTVVEEVELRVRATGRGASVIVYMSRPDGRNQRVESAEADDNGDIVLHAKLPLKPFADGGWYWFDIVAGPHEATLEEADWSARVPADRAEQRTATIGITTMNRPDFCAALLQQIGSEPHVLEAIDEVLVIDQGTQKVRDDEGFPAAEQALQGRLRVIDQGNIGGSGGFARAQAETLKAGRSAYVLFYDDDIEAEPESILRAIAFGDLARTPTIVGGHMFSLYSKARLHSFGEIINRYRFWWMSPPTVETDWDFAARNLRSARWVHRRIDVDFNPWFMCLIPVEVMREIGLGLPLFIKWDDSEYGVRAGAAGFPTVTLPGAAVWHVPWTDKNDALDWQSYYHQRNRFVAALLHSPYDRGGRMVRESFNHQIKHLFSMQYSTAEMRHRALEDVLSGPEHLHATLGTKLAEVRELRTHYADAQAQSDPDAFPPPRRKKPPKRGIDPTTPMSKAGHLKTMVVSAVRQWVPPRELATRHPEHALAAMDASWTNIAKFDSVLVSMPDGNSAAWYRRDPDEFSDLLRRTVAIHQRLLMEWPEIARTYREALPELTSVEAWEKTFAESLDRGC